MKLARYGSRGMERPALVDRDGNRDISAYAPDISPDILSAEHLEAIAALDIDNLPVVKDSHVRLGPPVSTTGKIICIGLNYTDHATEVGLALPKSLRFS